MDAKYIKVNCAIPGLENLAGCGDLCSVLQELGRLIVENGGNGSALTVTLSTIDRAQGAPAPLGSTVATSAACEPLTEYRWTIENLATNQAVTFAGAPTADASHESYVINGSYSLPLVDWNAVGGQLCNYRVFLTVTDSCNRYATDVKTSLLPAGTLYRQAFTFTHIDQVITVPACATKMRAKCWGGGGHSQSYLLTHGGGAGGYTEAVIPVTPGETLRVMVGEGGDYVSSYGFAGTTNHGVGGGLSGIFRKPVNLAVIAGDANYALIVAGGGGGADYGGTAQSRGGNGNDPVYSGGQNSMQGISDNTEGNASYNGGGGGGYRGGGKHYRDSVLGQAATLPYGGEGGSGFVIASATDVVMLATPDGQRTAPNSSDPDYQTGIAVGGPGAMVDGNGGNGLVVIYWLSG